VRTHVEFRSSAFPAADGEDVEINPGRWGKALATYLRHELTDRGEPGGAPYAEDWGWTISIDNDEFALWVGCGNYEEYPDGFLCFIEPSKPTVRKLFRRIDTTQRVTRVADALDAALKAHPDIRDIRWWSESEVGGR
jgi:hypothetical protein